MTQQQYAGPPLTFNTATDLSSSVGYAAKVSTSRTAALCSSQGEYCDGVIIDGESGSNYSVALETRPGHTVPAIAGTNGVTDGSEVTTDASGKFEDASSADWVRGRALGAASSGEEFELLLFAPYIKA